MRSISTSLKMTFFFLEKNAPTFAPAWTSAGTFIRLDKVLAGIHPLFRLDKVLRQDFVQTDERPLQSRCTRRSRSGLHFLFHKKKQMTLSFLSPPCGKGHPLFRWDKVLRQDFVPAERMDLTKSNRFYCTRLAV